MSFHLVIDIHLERSFDIRGGIKNILELKCHCEWSEEALTLFWAVADLDGIASWLRYY